MDFSYTEEQSALRDAISRWADKAMDNERRRAQQRAGGLGRPVYAELSALGLSALVIPEDQGGLGCGPIEALLTVETLGRHGVSSPFIHGALVAPTLLVQAPALLQKAWLPRMARGEALVVLAHQERGTRYRLDTMTTRAHHDGSRWLLEGDKSIVPYGDEAQAFIVPACCEGLPETDPTIGLFLLPVDAAGVAVRGYPCLDGGRAAELHLRQSPGTLITIDGLSDLEMAFDVGAAAICAEAVGVMDRMLTLTTEHLRTRRQFGNTLANFQALRHRVADMHLSLELARSMSFLAALKLHEAADIRHRAVSQAKIQIGQSMRCVGQQGVQLHGGMGMTDEHEASHCFRRLTALELQFGDSLHHLGEVAARLRDSTQVLA